MAFGVGRLTALPPSSAPVKLVTLPTLTTTPAMVGSEVIPSLVVPVAPAVSSTKWASMAAAPPLAGSVTGISVKLYPVPAVVVTSMPAKVSFWRM